jgi:hypothetical protein
MTDPPASPEPSDSDIENLLLQTAPQRWETLGAAVDALLQEREYLTWDGGQQVGTVVVDGVERPVVQVPYAVYTDATERVLDAYRALGIIVAFAWPEWDGIDRSRGPTALDSAPVADAVRMMTAIIRSERFSEGSIGGALEEGTMFAALRRLRRWHEGERDSH